MDGIFDEIELSLPRLSTRCVHHIYCGASHNILTLVATFMMSIENVRDMVFLMF